MIWALDMDDFSGKFCRKNRKKSLKRFPLVTAMKEELEQVETLTSITTTSIETTTISNETILSQDEFKVLLDRMFDEASSASSIKKFRFYVLIFILSILK